MKIKHKVNIPWDYVPPSHVETDDRYLAELEAARRKAEKAWRRAQQALKRAEARLAAKPDPDLRAIHEAAIAAFEERERELREIEELMRAPGSSQPKAVHRAGRVERLEVGVERRPSRGPSRNSPVVVSQRKR